MENYFITKLAKRESEINKTDIINRLKKELVIMGMQPEAGGNDKLNLPNKLEFIFNILLHKNFVEITRDYKTLYHDWHENDDTIMLEYTHFDDMIEQICEIFNKTLAKVTLYS